MDSAEFYRYLKLFNTALTVLFVVFLFNGRGQFKTRNRILALFFLTIAIGNIDYLIFLFRLEEPLIHVRFLGFPFLFLSAPMMMFYIISVYREKFRFKLIHVLHVIPFCIASIWLGAGFYFFGALTKRSKIFAGFHPRNFPLLWYGRNFQTAVYMIVSIGIIFLLRKKLKAGYSSLKKVTLDWVLFYFSSVCILSSITMIKDIPAFLSHKSMMAVLLESLHFLLLCFVFYKGLTQPAIFLIGKQNQQKSPLSEQSRNYYFDKLLRIMKDEKPYLDPDLTLTVLAGRVSISPYYLSSIINRCTGGSFYDFINK